MDVIKQVISQAIVQIVQIIEIMVQTIIVVKTVHRIIRI